MAKRTNQRKRVTLSDEGLLTIAIQGGDNDGKSVDVDVMACKIAIEPVEKRHGVAAKEWTATADFLKDLADTVAKHLGLSTCSGTFAYKLWHLVSKRWIELKKNIEA